MRKLFTALTVAAAVMAAPATALAFPACDSFGQDWDMTLGAFGGAFPGTSTITGCRDCNQSLGCGAALTLDGAVVYTLGANLTWSITAYNGSSCVSTHWTGTSAPGSGTINGNVSNEFGPFGGFSLTLRPCAAAAGAGADPATGQ